MTPIRWTPRALLLGELALCGFVLAVFVAVVRALGGWSW